MENPVQAVVTALIVAMALVVGVIIVDGVTTGTDAPGDRTATSDNVLLEGAGTWVRIDTENGYDETVFNSRGHAVNLTGANDSFIQSQDEFTIAEDDTWTVSVWGFVDNESKDDTMTLVSADGRVIIDYNGSAGNWTAWYFDDGSRDSHRVNISAPNQPESWAMVTVRSNGSHLTIYRNATEGETEDLSTESIASANVNATNWDGRMDELRTFDDALSDSEISSLQSQPNHPQKDTNRTARAMFDEPNRATQRLFFTNTELTTSNVTFSDGLPGQEMDGVGIIATITGSTDYEWDTDGPRIRPVSGGELDGAPMAYVDYGEETSSDKIVTGFTDSVEMAAMFPLLLIAVVVVARIRNWA